MNVRSPSLLTIQTAYVRDMAMPSHRLSVGRLVGRPIRPPYIGMGLCLGRYAPVYAHRLGHIDPCKRDSIRDLNSDCQKKYLSQCRGFSIGLGFSMWSMAVVYTPRRAHPPLGAASPCPRLGDRPTTDDIFSFLRKAQSATASANGILPYVKEFHCNTENKH